MVYRVFQPNTTLKKKKAPHTTQWKAPTGNFGQQALFTKDTANLFIQYQVQHLQEGNSHMIFSSHQDRGVIKRACLPLHLNLNAISRLPLLLCAPLTSSSSPIMAFPSCSVI